LIGIEKKTEVSSKIKKLELREIFELAFDTAFDLFKVSRKPNIKKINFVNEQIHNLSLNIQKRMVYLNF
jgi:hypothetical protein